MKKLSLSFVFAVAACLNMTAQDYDTFLTETNNLDKEEKEYLNPGDTRHIDVDIDETASETVTEETLLSFGDNPSAVNAASKPVSKKAPVQGSNISIRKDQLKFMDRYQPNKKTLTFFAPSSFKAYSCEDFIGNDNVSKTTADTIRKSIELVIGYKYVASDLLTKYRLFSPDSEEAEKFMHSEVGENNYDRTKMNHYVFYRLEGIGGYTLDEEIEKETDGKKKALLISSRDRLDWEYFDENVNSDFINKLDFKKATTYLVVKGGLYAFKTHDGRKGVIWLNYLNNFNNPIPISIRRYAIQTVGAKK